MEHKMENMNVNSEAQAVKIDAQAMKIDAQAIENTAQAVNIAADGCTGDEDWCAGDWEYGPSINIADMHIQMENMAKEQNGCKFANSVQTAVMQDQLTVLDAQIRKDRNQHFSELAALFATTRVLRFDLNATNLSNEN